MFSKLFSRSKSGPDPSVIGFDDFEEAVKADACVVVDVREPHRVCLRPHSEGAQPADVEFRREPAAFGQAGRADLSGGWALAQGAQRGAGERPRRRRALCRRHERVANARRRHCPLNSPSPVHVYRGDFMTVERSMWDPETIAEARYDFKAVAKAAKLSGGALSVGPVKACAARRRHRSGAPRGRRPS